MTLLNTVPSAMRELVRTNATPASVRIVNLAGEALPAELVHQTADVYIQAFEMITGTKFQMPALDEEPLARIRRNLTKYFEEEERS